jgi:hypothetical protein
MKSKENIAEELKLISEFVAAIPRGEQPPYALPEGYFDGLAAKVMEVIKASELSLTKNNPYTVPQEYFEGFAGKLLARIKAGQTDDPREELSVLSPLLDSIDKKSPFQLPEGYFNDLTGNILSGVQAIGFVNDELENLSPLMTGLRDRSVYQAPEGYFDDLSTSILTRLKEQQTAQQISQQADPVSQQADPIPAAKQAPVISMDSRRDRLSGSGNGGSRVGISKWLKYSAAAVAAGLILTMGWLGLYSPAPTAGGSEVATNLSKVSDQEILNYLDNQNIPASETVTNSTATLDLNDVDVKNILGSASDDELNQYLEDNGGTKEPVTN